MSKPRKYMRCDLLGPSVGGRKPRWINGVLTDRATARRQFANAPGTARLVHLQITENLLEAKGDRWLDNRTSRD